MRCTLSIGKSPRLGRRWSHLLTVTLTACLFMNTPGLAAPAAEVESREVLALQSLVAGMVNPAAAPLRHGNAPMSVLDVQRLLGGGSGASKKQAPVATYDSWAVAPALHRGALPDPAPTAATRTVEIPRTSEEGLRQRVESFAPPPLSRAVERYRMMLTPHAPPSPPRRPEDIA